MADHIDNDTLQRLLTMARSVALDEPRLLSMRHVKFRNLDSYDVALACEVFARDATLFRAVELRREELEKQIAEAVRKAGGR